MEERGQAIAAWLRRHCKCPHSKSSRSTNRNSRNCGKTLRSMGLGGVEEEVRHELDYFRIASGYEVDFSIASLRTLVEVDGEPALL